MKSDCIITALSPSNESIHHSKIQFAELLPESNVITRLPSLKPNNSSIVLWISVSDKNVLLGSDLENEKKGWISILDSTTKPIGKASVYKIPHHGSANSDSPRIWEEVLTPNPHAIMSPFQKGNIKLPKISDIQKICEQTTNGYITTSNEIRKPKDRSKISRMMTQNLKNRRLTHPSFGSIRLRTKLNGLDSSWNVQLFGDAQHLSNLLH